MLSPTILTIFLTIASAAGICPDNVSGTCPESLFSGRNVRQDRLDNVSGTCPESLFCTDGVVSDFRFREDDGAGNAGEDRGGVKERCERYTMKNQGLEREYYLYRPEGLKAGAPLVIVLHGYGGSALKGKKEMMDVADSNGFAVCYPQGVKDPKGKAGWNVRYPSQEGMKTDDVKFILALSKELQKRFDLSSKNTFLTGMSNGGDIIYLIAMRAPKAFKAMASIAGLQFSWMETEYSYRHPVPFMEVHGTQDHTSEWLGDPRNEGGWGAYIPVPAAVSRIIAVNGCTEEYVTELPCREGRNQVTLYQFKAGKPVEKGGRPTEVWLYKVEGGGHSWSDKDMDTCSEIWRFFSRWVD